MSKITFRADDDLVEELETFDTSKSEVMREALREYLDAADDESADQSDADTTEDAESLDDLVAARLDEMIEQRVDAALEARLGADGRATGGGARGPQDVNVQVTVDGARPRSENRSASANVERARGPRPPERTATDDRKTSPDARTRADSGRADVGGTDADRRACTKCGESVDEDHVYCPNCGAKASRRLFCECGDELRSDWAFCPSCGRRTAAADVLDSP